MDNAEMRKRLKKLTGGEINLATKGELIQAIKSGVIDWCVTWTGEKYPQRELKPGDVLTDREISSIAAKVYHAIRGLVY